MAPRCFPRKRKYVYGPTRKDVHEKWVKLHNEAKKGPVATNTPTLAQYLAYWLKGVVEPNLRPLTAATYETMVRLHIVPFLGSKRLDRLTVQDMRSWLNKLAETCQCCVQEKDARRPEEKQRCCAVRKCCRQTLSKRSVNDARTILRSALTNAMVEERISKNVAQLVKVQRARRKRPDPWSVEETCTFLENAQTWRDCLYGAYVLILVLGLRKGEVLGLTWSDVNLDTGELHIRHQLQRVRRRLLHTDTAKTEASEAVLPLPDICLAALRLRRKEQEAAKVAAGDLWTESDLVFTTRHGTPVEPRNFTREFNRRCDRAKVRQIRVHDTRHTCASLLAALDVQPRIAMQILRHSEIAVTMEVYTHVPSSETRRGWGRPWRQQAEGRQEEGHAQAGRAVGHGRSARFIAVAVLRCCTYVRGPFTIT